MKEYFYMGKNIKELSREELEIAYGKVVDFSKYLIESEKQHIEMDNLLNNLHQ